VHAAAIEGVAPTWSDAAEVLGRELLGGCILGVLGWLLIHHLLPRSADYATGLLVSLPAVTGLYVTSLHLHVSGPSTTVVAGLLAGNLTLYKLNAGVLVPLRNFWKGLDEVLNALLFVFVGLHIVLIDPLAGVVTGVPGSVAILAVLAGRAVAVRLAVSGLDALGAIRASRWGGPSCSPGWPPRRAVAGACGVAAGQRLEPLLLNMTFATVVFSIVVQGLTIQRLFGKADLVHLLGR
jgi:monovalent cation:H+ antiporter, CPA1 family